MSAREVMKLAILAVSAYTLLLVSGCQKPLSAEATSPNAWHPNTSALDVHDKFTGDSERALAHDVKRFYQLLRDKRWRKTYELRAKAFREATPEFEYLADAKKEGKHWSLINYDVLSVNLLSAPGSTNVSEAMLICKFIEGPGHLVSYSAVFWHKEDGVWKCLSAGPSELSIFQGTRVPYIDWR